MFPAVDETGVPEVVVRSAVTFGVAAGDAAGAEAVHPAKNIAMMTRMIVTKLGCENFMVYPLTARVIFPAGS